jgi:hypothetical protein
MFLSGHDRSTRKLAQADPAVKGIAYMEAIMGPQYWDHWDKFGMRAALQGLRSEKGEEMILRDNFFIEKILPGAILRPSPPRKWRSTDGVRRARRGAAADADVASTDPH